MVEIIGSLGAGNLNHEAASSGFHSQLDIASLKKRHNVYFNLPVALKLYLSVIS